MPICKSASADQLQLVGRFEDLRKTLVSDRYADHLEKPLAYWALPVDRRLPLAFLEHTLEDILNSTFAELAQTQGIGQKKITAMLKLLARAADNDPAETSAGAIALSNEIEFADQANGKQNENKPYESTNISEITWSRWRAAAVGSGLENETLGRFATSLRNMTRGSWNTPLGDYVNRTLREIRAMKTHGVKRVLAIIDAFHNVYMTSGENGIDGHPAVRLAPRPIDRVEQWIGSAMQAPGVPDKREIFDEFINPLLEQLRIDAMQQVVRLAEHRLDISGPVTSVRQVARTMGLTRARVYQLFGEIHDIMAVRWPNSRRRICQLREKFQVEAAGMEHAPDLQQFYSAVELFWPNLTV